MTGLVTDNRFRSLTEVEAYWEGLRMGDAVPRRADIDPRGIENALEYAFVLERIAPGLARLRIAGMHLNDLMGMEMRGMPISAMVQPTGRTGFARTLEAVMSRPAVARITLSAQTGIGKPSLDGRMLLLPLLSDMGEITRVLGCFETHGQIGRAPRRFSVTQTDLRNLPGQGSRKALPPQRAEAGFAEGQRRFDRPRPGLRPGYLRLVKSDG
ncbi:PAS domain-containing protein [Aquicoccus porphyridii]|uniref:PAS domain-containing protein n=2 Tax=Aquicoccus porphyridii TaxID=1852029 RepID=A0A5A9ZVW2_9RHOB|nr:PAS domain-containing protein [Aquicoccus porphyridii]RAI56861.1 PAS domain-containing protein [Rhodobacteraceae bacterium AsT-22]